MSQARVDISVVMAVHNGRQYLAQAIDSILAQTCSTFEFIIIDDGSTDGSLEVLRTYAARDPRIRLVSRPNKGLTASLNEGLALAQGGFVARMDGDDIALPQRFAQQLVYLQTHPECVAVGCWLDLMDPEGDSLGIDEKPLAHAAIDALHMRGLGGGIPHPAAMLRRAALQAVGGYNEKYVCAQDYDLWLRLAEHGQLANLPAVLMRYRFHVGSVSHTKTQRQVDATIDALQRTCARRGVPMPADYAGQGGVSYAASESSLMWAGMALGQRQFATARKHAWRAARAHPFSIVRWALLTQVLYAPAGTAASAGGQYTWLCHPAIRGSVLIWRKLLPVPGAVWRSVRRVVRRGASHIPVLWRLVT